MAKDLNPKEAQAFAKFLEKRKVLIADASASSRSGLFMVFRDLGAKTGNLILVNTFNQAASAIISEKPQIVIAEYDLDKRCGLELFQSQREQRPTETKDCIFVIVTGNTSQSAVAKSAEEEIDAYILKPYTPEVVRQTVIKAAVAKIHPSEYAIGIEEAKKHIATGNFDEAEKELKRVIPLEKAPSLALYYLGQVDYIKKILDKAKGSYSKGLEFNKIHYRCLVGLYELLASQNDNVNAYEVVKRISQYFPANPKRLGEVLRLAIVTAKYEDIEKYYQVFINIDERNETLVKYVCAALVVCGKYYLGTQIGHRRAQELFKKAAATGQGRTGILKEIINALLEYGMHKEASEFLTRFPPDAYDSNEFLLLRFLVQSASSNSPMIIDQGRALMAKGVTDERFFNTMIKKSAEIGVSAMAMDELMNKACIALPDKKTNFENLLKKYKKTG